MDFMNYTDLIKMIEGDGFRVIRSKLWKSYNELSIEVSRASAGDFFEEAQKLAGIKTEYAGLTVSVKICRQA